MAMAAAALTFFFHVADFAARGDFPVTSDDAAAGKSCEAEKPNETHTTLFANLGPNPRVENVADLRDARLTAEQISYRREGGSLFLCLRFVSANPAVTAARVEPTWRSLPTVGFDLRQLGVWESAR